MGRPPLHGSGAVRCRPSKRRRERVRLAAIVVSSIATGTATTPAAMQRLAHRRKRAVLEKQQLLERKLKAEEEATRKLTAVLENKGRYKTFDIQRSVKMPIRARKGRKKRGKGRMPAR